MAANLPAGGVDNIILCTDSYKGTHHLQYPPKTTLVYSYFESRGGEFSSTIFFGLQYILKRWLVGPVVTNEKIEEAKALLSGHFGNQDNLFNEAGWRYIVEKHGGCLPVRIKAVPEGTLVPTRHVLITVENTDPKCFWLTNFLETLIVQVWYPMTVCTSSYVQKEVIAKYLHETAESLETLPYKLHDFGYRGSSSVETAGIGGAAHLVNFKGTDTLAAVMMARRYYGADIAGYSIPAAEHSTITTWTKSGEVDAFRNMLVQFPNCPVAVVSDSYNIYDACRTLWGEKLKNLIVSRGEGRPLLVRPDSGEPDVVVAKILKILAEKFGTTKNSKGFLMLPPYIRVIQGDGISYETLGKILTKIKAMGWSSENLVFGSGGALLQKVNRDTLKCAYKCSFAVIDSKPVHVFKSPIDDPVKKSKRGRLRLEKNGDVYTTIEEVDKTDGSNFAMDELVPVFENGQLLRDYSFDEIRQRAEIPLLK